AASAVDEVGGPRVYDASGRITAVVNVECTKAGIQETKANAREVVRNCNDVAIARPGRWSIVGSFSAIGLIGNFGPFAFFIKFIIPQHPTRQLGKRRKRRGQLPQVAI